LRTPQLLGGSDDRRGYRPQGGQELVNGDQEEGIVIERLAATGNTLLGRPVAKEPDQSTDNAGRSGEERAIENTKG